MQELRRQRLLSFQWKRLLQERHHPHSSSPVPVRQLIFFLDPAEAQGLRDSLRHQPEQERFPKQEQELRPELLAPQEREPAQAQPQALLLPVKEPAPRLTRRGQLRQEIGRAHV